jgi:hypothetical protein
METLDIGHGRNEIALSHYLLNHRHRPAIVTCKVEGKDEWQPRWHEVDGVPLLILPSPRLGIEGIVRSLQDPGPRIAFNWISWKAFPGLVIRDLRRQANSGRRSGLRPEVPVP